MKNIDVSEVYTLFEEIRELVKAGNRNSTVVQPEIELPNLSAIFELFGKLDETINEIRKQIRMEHHHIFSIASSKVFTAVIGLCVVCLFCLFTMFYQRKEIKRTLRASFFVDHDWKHDYSKICKFFASSRCYAHNEP